MLDGMLHDLDDTVIRDDSLLGDLVDGATLGQDVEERLGSVDGHGAMARTVRTILTGDGWNDAT